MNARNFELASQVLGNSTYMKQAADGRHQCENLVKVLLSQRRMPEEGWGDRMIELFLHELAAMDSNNFIENVGVGEREGRIYSDIVARRHFRMAHGIGRSGNILDLQPKAAGSALLYRLTNALALDAIKTSGITRTEACVVVPMATGMALTLCLLALKAKRPEATFVIWPRIDQRTCLKCIVTAGCTPLVVPNKLEGDELRTDIDEIQRLINEKGADRILCIISTTSCFAPRGYDDVEAIAKIAQKESVPHIINNAYGLQASKCTHMVNEAIRVGRVDAFVQSTDKNFMVPIGGAIIASPSASTIDHISKTYPGRASSAPITDLFITLLSMGRTKYKELLKERKRLFELFIKKLTPIAEKYGERVLQCPHNTISIAMSLSSFPNPKKLGAILFNTCISGVRVVDPADSKEVAGFTFTSYGAHFDNYPVPYLTVAGAIGLTEKEIDIFLSRLDRTLSEYRAKHSKETTV